LHRRETADIVYVDSQGDLTALLIEKGYMESGIWEAERPTYYLEVKTTMRDFSEQFYMSDYQYRLVSPTRNNPKINVANKKKMMTDAKNASTATRRSLRHFASFQPRGKNWPPSISRS
jgi:hypothetical protein